MAIDWLQTGVIVAAAGIAYMWFFREKRDEEPPEEIPDFPEPENKDMTLAELSKYNGRNEEVEKRIYIGIAGKIYDVTTRPGFYGVEGPYNCFTGHDATFALARGTLDLADMDIENPPALKRYEYYQLQDWLGTFARYHVVGNLIDRPAPEVEPSKIQKKKAEKAAAEKAAAEKADATEPAKADVAEAEASSGDATEAKPESGDQQGEGDADEPLPQKSLDDLNKATGEDASAGNDTVTECAS